MKAVFATLFLFAFTAFAYCAEDDGYTLVADRVIKIDNSTYQASGDVILKFRDMVFYADNITYNQTTEDVLARGNVKIVSPTQDFEASEISFNAKTEQGNATDIKGFLAPFNYLCAAKLDKTGPTTFSVFNARITTCPGDIPDWSFAMYSGNMEIEGYLNANHTTVNILNTPIAYFPKLVYPVSTRRQSGFLIPYMGVDSEKGVFINIKYFWAPTVNFDMTFGLGLFSKSGIQEQGEIRYADSEDSTFYGAFERIDDATSESDSLTRWRAILANKYVPIKPIELNLNADLVSDYLYVRDFGKYGIVSDNGKININKENMFYAEFNAKYNNKYTNINLLMRKDIEFRDTLKGYNKTMLDQAPSIDVSGVVTDIPYFIIDYGISYDDVNYKEYTYNSPATGVTGTWDYKRINTFAQIYAPIDIVFATLTPSVSAAYTRWFDSSKAFNFNSYYSNEFGGVSTTGSSGAERYSGSIGASLAFREIYRNYKHFRHGIQNNIIFNYAPDLEQQGLPDYIDSDRLVSAGSATYEMINFLTAKDWSVKLNLSQSYNILKDNDLLPLEIKLNFSLFSKVNIYTEMRYKHSGELKKNEHRMQYISTTANIDIIKTLSVYGLYSYDSTIPQGYYNTNAQVGASYVIWRLRLEGYYKWQAYNDDISFKNLVPLQQGAAITYNAECWSLGVQLETNLYNTIRQGQQVKSNEMTLYINFSLKGLGDGRLQFLRFKDSKENI